MALRRLRCHNRSRSQRLNSRVICSNLVIAGHTCGPTSQPFLPASKRGTRQWTPAQQVLRPDARVCFPRVHSFVCRLRTLRPTVCNHMHVLSSGSSLGQTNQSLIATSPTLQPAPPPTSSPTRRQVVNVVVVPAGDDAPGAKAVYRTPPISPRGPFHFSLTLFACMHACMSESIILC